MDLGPCDVGHTYSCHIGIVKRVEKRCKVLVIGNHLHLWDVGYSKVSAACSLVESGLLCAVDFSTVVPTGECHTAGC